MAMLNLTVQVLDLSPRVTLADLNIFFSYCGTVDTIRLQRTKDRSQLAFVTFKQPYAFQTALLLNGAIIVDHPVRVLTLQDSDIPISDKLNDETRKSNEKHGFVPAVNSAMQVMASKGVEMLNRTKGEIEENCKLSEKGRALVHHTRSAICSAEQAGALWLSGVLNKASKRAAELRTKKLEG